MIIITISLSIYNVKAETIEYVLKVGNKDIGATNYLSTTTSGVTYNMQIEYVYDNPTDFYNNSVDNYNFYSSYNNNSNPKSRTYNFLLTYCSNVGASATTIYNTNLNYVDINYNTQTRCTVSNGSNYYNGSLYNMYIRMTPTANTCGTEGEGQCIIKFNNTMQTVSQFTYNGYIAFTKITPMTQEEYEKAITNYRSLQDNREIINQIVNMITQQLATISAITEQTTQMLNADANSDMTPNKSNDYTQNEQQLINQMNRADFTKIDIAIDENSNNFVWQTMTNLLNTNTLIIGLFITILSIGIIKLVLGR